MNNNDLELYCGNTGITRTVSAYTGENMGVNVTAYQRRFMILVGEKCYYKTFSLNSKCP
jgi:hypothetical protein